MAVGQKNKLLRTLQIMEKTDEANPLNAAQINECLSSQFGMEKSDRKSIYKDIEALIECGYPVRQMKDPRKGWYFEKKVV